MEKFMISNRKRGVLVRGCLWGLSASAIATSIGCGGERTLPTAPTAKNAAPVTVAAPTPPPPLPAPTLYAVSGVVREVNGAPLSDVRVATNPPAASTTTDGAGAFSFTEIGQPILVFTKAGYRFTYWRRPAGDTSSTVSIVAKMQPRLTLSQEASLTSVITNDDITYDGDLEDSFWDGGYFCGPCKEISVNPVRRNGATFHLHWTGSVAPELWAGEYYQGVSAHAVGEAGTSELVLTVSGIVDTLLVGFGRLNGSTRALDGSMNFELALDRQN
jgi:hypothetical protein